MADKPIPRPLEERVLYQGRYLTFEERVAHLDVHMGHWKTPEAQLAALNHLEWCYRGRVRMGTIPLPCKVSARLPSGDCGSNSTNRPDCRRA
jgi:hypothetical protein